MKSKFVPIAALGALATVICSAGYAADVVRRVPEIHATNGLAAAAVVIAGLALVFERRRRG